jgi:hypothetical protein
MNATTHINASNKRHYILEHTYLLLASHMDCKKDPPMSNPHQDTSCEDPGYCLDNSKTTCLVLVTRSSTEMDSLVPEQIQARRVHREARPSRLERQRCTKAS